MAASTWIFLGQVTLTSVRRLMAFILLWRSRQVRRRHKTRNSTTETNVKTTECKEKFPGSEGEPSGTTEDRSREGSIWENEKEIETVSLIVLYARSSGSSLYTYLGYNAVIQASIGVGGPPHALIAANDSYMIDGLNRGRRCICHHLIVLSAYNNCLVPNLCALAHLDIVRRFLHNGVGVLDVRIAASYRTA